MHTRINPPELLSPAGFAHLAAASGRFVYISGQVAEDASGTLVGKDDFVAQLEQVFRHLEIAVRAAGASFSDVVKLTYYCVDSVDRSLLPHVARVRDAHIDRAQPPASTFIFVAGLVRRSWLIEIDAVVCLPSP